MNQFIRRDLMGLMADMIASYSVRSLTLLKTVLNLIWLPAGVREAHYVFDGHGRSICPGHDHP